MRLLNGTWKTYDQIRAKVDELSASNFLMKKAIVVFAFARAQLLRDCIQSILSADGSQNWLKVLVLQVGHAEVEEVVREFEANFDLVLRLKAQHQTALGNINQNRITGTSICFDLLGSDIVLGIEEDTMIGYDALCFIDQMVERYHSNKAFRGINLGSLEPKTEENFYSYSLLRFGLHGQAGALTRKTWEKFSPKELLGDISREGWDSKIEYQLKTGFMATPNASRFLDRGWAGTHAPSDSMHPYFEKQRLSWVGRDPITSSKFLRMDVRHSWRIDAVNFRLRDSVFFIIRGNPIGYLFYRFWRKLRLPKFTPSR